MNIQWKIWQEKAQLFLWQWRTTAISYLLVNTARHGPTDSSRIGLMIKIQIRICTSITVESVRNVNGRNSHAYITICGCYFPRVRSTPTVEPTILNVLLSCMNAMNTLLRQCCTYFLPWIFFALDVALIMPAAPDHTRRCDFWRRQLTVRSSSMFVKLLRTMKPVYRNLFKKVRGKGSRKIRPRKTHSWKTVPFSFY